MDAFTLVVAVEDVRRALTQSVVRGVFPAGPVGLWLELVTEQGVDSLLIAADETFPRLSRGVPRPPRTRTLSPLAGLARRILPSSRLEAVAQRGLERVVTLEFTLPFAAGGDASASGGACHLIAELFGPRPNLVITDPASGRILEAARHGEIHAGRSFTLDQTYVPPPATSRPDPRLLGSSQAIQNALPQNLLAADAPALALRVALAGITDRWAHEVAARAGETDPAALAKALTELIQRVERGPWEPQLLLDLSGNPCGISPIRLVHLPDGRQELAASLGEAAERLAGYLAARRGLEVRQRALRQVLRRLEDRLQSRRAKLVKESQEFARADVYRRMGKLLVAYQAEIPRGATEATLPDLAEGEGATLAVPLDPALSLMENAERLFKSARRGRRGAMRVTARLAETDRELQLVQTWMERWKAADTPAALLSLQDDLGEVPRLLSSADRAALAEASPASQVAPRRATQAAQGARPARTAQAGRKAGPEPRRFVSSEGFPILVGRDNEGNDYLTLHLSRSEDLWLHVEGFPGSHVVIRAQKRTGGIPRRTLIEAAQLAAYYSQARNHGKVTVSYALRKYVRKPRKSPPGLVTITQEKTIVVKPDKSLVSKLATPDD